MMEFDSQEMAIIDSPFLQRLRNISQLGFSYLTYPSAEHSRFSHSLGVAHVVKRFLEQTVRNADAHIPPSSPHGSAQLEPSRHDEEMNKLVTYAALLHDIGHFPYSHATETALHHYSESVNCGISFEDFLFPFEEHLGIFKPKFAECFSAIIVMSTEFAAFFKSKVDREVTDVQLLKIALLILGIPPDPQSPGISSVISHSNVDADKIDYLKRDSMLCGIPVGIDSARLFFRTMFLDISPDSLRSLSPDNFKDVRATQKHFIVNASGIDTIDEIVHARSIMYQRVYRHKTTRLAERMFQKALFSDDKKIEALDVWSKTESKFFEEAREVKKHTNSSLQYFNLGARKFQKRALVFSRSCIAELTLPPNGKVDPEFATKIFKDAIGKAASDLEVEKLHGDKLQKFETSIEKSSEALRDLLLRSGKFENCLPSNRCTVTILPMEATDGQSNKMNHILLSGDQLDYYRDVSGQNPRAEGDEITKKIGYIFADKDWCEIVHIAARKQILAKSLSKVLHQIAPDEKNNEKKGVKNEVKNEKLISYKVKFILDPVSSLKSVSLNRDLYNQINHHLTKYDTYYNDSPSLVENTVSVSADLVRKFSEFNGVGNWKITEEHISNFISQFPPILREEALNLIESVEVIGRNTIKKGLHSLLNTTKEKMEDSFTRGTIFGFTPNSGNSLMLFGEQEFKMHAEKMGWTFSKTITKDSIAEALKNNGAVMFVDDNLGSGTQARAQIRSYFGINKDDWPTELQSEKNVAIGNVLFDENTKYQNVSIGLLIADPNGIKAFNSDTICKKMGITANFVNTFEDINSGIIISDDMTSFLTDVGAALIKQNWDKPTKSDCQSNSLGYDSKTALLITMFNVPTSTITPFWMPGVYNNLPWLPLFIRRGYQNRIVV